MGRVFSNGPLKDFVINPFRNMAAESTQLCIAAPYVIMTDDLAAAANSGKSVCLLVGLNPSTSPQALSAVHGRANCTVRYFTRRFHAKIYLFDNEALVGSSNLTENGLQFNREAMISIDQVEELDELRALFKELWDSAETLADEKLKSFAATYSQIKRPVPDLDTLKIEDAVGRSEPPNITVGSEKKPTKGMFLEQLRRQVYEYRGSFSTCIFRF
jgi:phosphatidylserine/phosphatidylglycerophosphate/cardiolipin synthase-like enzyme